GGRGNDELQGGEGNDTLKGGLGADKLYGAEGNDNISGGEGNDIAYGGVGNDIVKGGKGDDTLSGSEGDDVVFGGDGNDKLSGANDNDTLVGGRGNDDINGGSGDDLMLGGDGNDVLSGSSGSDIAYGGEGNNAIQLGSGNNVVAYDGKGNDTVVDFSARDDKIVIPRSIGMLSLAALGLAQDGADTVLTIGDYSLRLENVDVEDITESNIEFVSDEDFAEMLSVDSVLAVEEQAVVAQLDGSFLATGSLLSEDNTIGHWHIKSIQLDSTVYEVSDSTVVIQTEHGELTVFGKDDPRHIEGEYAYHLNSSAVAEEALEHFDLKLENDIGDMTDATFDIVAGEDADDVLNDLAFDAVIDGTAGNNLLVGNSDDNEINGFAGNDIIDGGLGNDLISGGAGSDNMYGGEGSDTFVFLKQDGGEGTVDVIQDYSPSLDLLDFSDLLDTIESEDLSSYLVALENNEENEATLSLASNGEDVDQQITFSNLSVADLADAFDMPVNSTGQDVISNMLEENKILINSF
ncbi:calcium-binding protein, partial [Enterovibrio norvegicus]